VSRLLSIFFLSAYLTGVSLPSDAIREMGKFDTLFTHYQEHQVETPEISFLAFLFLHYGEDFKQHAAEHQHDSLPGKHSEESPQIIAHGITVMALPASLSLRIDTPLTVAGMISTLEPHLHSIQAGLGVWQPPRLA
jgi:hypothetical protein